jgi:hypothetical protein
VTTPGLVNATIATLRPAASHATVDANELALQENVSRMTSNVNMRSSWRAGPLVPGKSVTRRR